MSTDFNFSFVLILDRFNDMKRVNKADGQVTSGF